MKNTQMMKKYFGGVNGDLSYVLKDEKFSETVNNIKNMGFPL